jgi:hypothetical protein
MKCEALNLSPGDTSRAFCCSFLFRHYFRVLAWSWRCCGCASCQLLLQARDNNPPQVNIFCFLKIVTRNHLSTLQRRSNSLTVAIIPPNYPFSSTLQVKFAPHSPSQTNLVIKPARRNPLSTLLPFNPSIIGLCAPSNRWSVAHWARWKAWSLSDRLIRLRQHDTSSVQTSA